MRLLFYPDARIDKTRVKRALDCLPEIKVVRDFDFDVCIHWDYNDLIRFDPLLMEWVERGKKIFNLRLNNVTKKAVDGLQKWALGYSSLVPDDFHGECIAKRNKQSRGNPMVVSYPECRFTNDGLDEYDPDYRIHQKIIGTKDGEWCVDYRVFVFKNDLWVVEKRKPIRHRFKSNAKVYLLKEMKDVFNTKETKGINDFLALSGLDFGEVDVLRDNKDGKIYIIDINNIPGGGGPWATADGGKIFNRYVESFKNMIC